MHRHTLPFLKIVVLIAILSWLAIDIQRNDPETFSRMQDQPKDWGRLFIALLLCFAAVLLSFIRWFFLVRALRIPFQIGDALRLGFLGYLLNFIALGSVGGDLFKALAIAREQQTRRLEAVATIAVDRIVGLGGLLVVTSCAVLLFDAPRSLVQIRLIEDTTLVLTTLAAVTVLIAMIPGITGGKLVSRVETLPKIGPFIQRLITALQMYRSQKKLLLGVGIMSIIVHGLITVAIFLAAGALFREIPTLVEHFIICPMASVVGSLPISPSGLGTYEFAMRYLYDHLPADGAGQGKGLVVALCFRLMQIGVAGIGIVVYYMNRRQVTAILEEANSELRPE